jgi:hypothetical protein
MLDPNIKAEPITITPDMAMQLLEHNTLNRPLSDAHVKHIASQIADGKWKFNGDTIKISVDDQVLDGQHRLWACIESKKPIDTIIVRGVKRDAFSTIDTIRRSRSVGDTVALQGVTRHRNMVGGAIMWLARWQRGYLPNYKAPQNRIENSDVEDLFDGNRNIVAAVERAMPLRRICNPSVLAFIFYVTANRNQDLAVRFMEAMEDPSKLAMVNPLFQFRAYLTTPTTKARDPVQTIALAFKALSAEKAGRLIKLLKWASQGNNAEAFPELDI